MQTVSILIEFLHADDSAFMICLSGKVRPIIVGVDVFAKESLENGVADLLTRLALKETSFKIIVTNPNSTKIVLGLLKRVKELGLRTEFTNAHFIRKVYLESAKLDISPDCIGQTNISASDVAEGLVPKWIRLACIRATQLWTVVVNS